VSGERRHRRVCITPELILAALATGNRLDAAVVEAGIPDGAVVVGCGMREQGDVFFLIEHPSFGVLVEGQDIPLHDIRITRRVDSQADGDAA